MEPESDLRGEFRDLAGNKDFGALEDRWIETIEAVEGEVLPDIEPFIDAADALLDASEKARADVLLDLTVPIYEGRLERPKLLELLRRRCLAAPDNLEVRSQFATLFREHFGSTSVESEYLKLTDFEKAPDIHATFQKLDHWMSFREGTYVFHGAGWGVGRIESIDPLLKQAVVSLEKRPNHRMTLEAIGTVLEPLADNHFLVLEAQGGDRIREMVETDPVGLIKTVLASFGNPLRLKDIKPYLSPQFIAANAWSKWWNRTKKELRQNGFFRIGDRAPYMVEMLEEVFSYEDELTREFESADWTVRRSVARKVLKGRRDHPRLHDIVVRELRRTVDESVGSGAIGAACLLERFVPEPAAAKGELLERAIGACPQPIQAVLGVEGSEEQRMAVLAMPRVLREAWRQAALELWVSESDVVRDALFSGLGADGLEGEVSSRVAQALGLPRLSPGLFVWSVRRFVDGSRGGIFAAIERLDGLQLLNRVLDLLDHVSSRAEREEESHRRNVLSRAQALLSYRSFALVKKATEGLELGRARELYERFRHSNGLGDQLRGDLVEVLARAVPAATRRAETPVWEEDAIYVTSVGLEKRQDELRDLMEEKLPKTFEDIGRAAAFGDLRENAEYKAALEQRDFLTRKATAIRGELDKVRLITPAMLKFGRVTLGSRVILQRAESGEEIVYRILGPWDGTPEEGVLSYKSPMARSLLGAKVGEEVEVKLPGGTERFKVVRVDPGIEEVHPPTHPPAAAGETP